VATYGQKAFAAGVEAASTHAIAAPRRPLKTIDRLLLQRLMARPAAQT
jgi:hypothetical protein